MHLFIENKHMELRERENQAHRDHHHSGADSVEGAREGDWAEAIRREAGETGPQGLMWRTFSQRRVVYIRLIYKSHGHPWTSQFTYK